MRRFGRTRSVWTAALLPCLLLPGSLRAAAPECPTEEAAASLSGAIRAASVEGAPLDDLRGRLAAVPRELPRACAGDAVCALRLDAAEAKLRLSDSDGSLNAFDEAITACGGQTAVAALRRAGAILVAKKEDLRAVNYYLRLVQKVESPGVKPLLSAPEIAEIHREIVRALHRLGEEDRAWHEAEHPAIAGWSLDAAADDLFILAGIASATRHWEAAAASLERLINVYPEDPRRPESLIALGVARVKLGSGAGARFLFDEIVRESPDSDAALQAKLEILDLSPTGPRGPLAVRRTLEEVATHALDPALGARAAARFLEIESRERGLPEALFSLVEWSRASSPLARDAVFRALQTIDAGAFSQGAEETLHMLSAAHALVETFGDGVLPFPIEAAASRAAYDQGLYELAARLSGATQDAETPEGAEEIRGLHIHALLAASHFEEAARTGARYLAEGSGVEVEIATCRALRALSRWEDLEKRVDAGPAPTDVVSQSLLELWRAEAVWSLGDPRAAAESAILFALAQAKRLPVAGPEARATLAELALLAGDGFYGAGEIGKSDEAYTLAKSLGGGTWRSEAAASGRALLDKDRARPAVTREKEPERAPSQEPKNAPSQEPKNAPSQEPKNAPAQEPKTAPAKEPAIAPAPEPSQENGGDR